MSDSDRYNIQPLEEDDMKVKTFSTALEIFHVKKQLADLDRLVNDFIENNKVAHVVSVSDTTTSGDRGATIGVIRVLLYE